MLFVSLYYYNAMLSCQQDKIKHNLLFYFHVLLENACLRPAFDKRLHIRQGRHPLHPELRRLKPPRLRQLAKIIRRKAINLRRLRKCNHFVFFWFLGQVLNFRFLALLQSLNI